jgi:glycosyltransferase involved in cell wall biosynthesis
MLETPTLNRRKKVVILTDSTIAFTGFGRSAKLYIEHLYRLNKYDLVHIAVGMTNVNQGELNRFPWRTYAAVDVNQLNSLKQNNDPKNHEGIERLSGYGAFTTEEIVKKEKPDILICCQDIWGIDHVVDKAWFNKITTVLWTTLDSLPILPKAVEIAPKAKHYWSWADFATKALHKLGHNHVRTVRGPADIKSFHRLNDEKKKQLRFENSIDEKTFVSIFLGRNQLRKSFPQMLQGFKLFKQDNPNSKILFHTNWQEGWNIPSLIKEYNLDNNDILTTYICKACKKYQVKSFTGHDLNCPHCKAQKTQVTTHPTIGVTEEQLNEIYNLADASMSIFTSGGQELHTIQSMLAELPTLVTNYSCGEDSCGDPNSGVFPVDWAEYREPGTQFIKATSYPSSISKQLNKIVKLSPKERFEIGKKSRKWAIDNFSVEVIGKQLEEFIDSVPLVENYSFDEKKEQKDPTYNIPEIQDNAEWITHMYHNVLKMKDVDSNNDGHRHWMNQISNGMSRKQIEEYFRKVAAEDNSKNNVQQVSLENFLDKSDKERVLLTLKESIGDLYLLTSLLPEVQKKYPLASIYIACDPKYNTIFDGNQYVKKCIPWSPAFENELFVCGQGPNKGLFNYFHNVGLTTQRSLSYLSAKY